jgi:hypothetical protein
MLFGSKGCSALGQLAGNPELLAASAAQGALHKKANLTGKAV